MQKFAARFPTTFSNGAVGYAPGGPMDCIGPYAKVVNCPIMVNDAEVARLTCYATGYADTWFSVPACTRRRGKYVRGYFMAIEEETDSGWTRSVVFHVLDSHKHLF